jgi:hypothetical protein
MTNQNNLDIEALASALNRGNRDISPKVKYSRKEKKAILKELKGKKKAKDVEAMKRGRRRAQDISAALKKREREQVDRTKAQRKARRDARSVQDMIGYDKMFRSGLCQVEEGLYSETIEYQDIAYQSTTDEAKLNIADAMCGVYNLIGADAILQQTVINEPLTKEALEQRSFFDEAAQQNENQRRYAHAYNHLLAEKIREGVSNLRRRRFVTVSCDAPSPERALPVLARYRSDITSILDSVRARPHKMDGQERLEVIHSMICPDSPFYFDYEHDITPYAPLTTKDFICPMSLDFRPEGASQVFKSGAHYCQVLTFKEFGSEITDNAFASIIDLQVPLVISWFSQGMDKGKAVEMVRQRIGSIDGEVIEMQEKAVDDGHDYNILPTSITYTKREYNELLHKLTDENQRLFWFTGVVMTWADSFEQVSEQALQIMAAARRNSIELAELNYRQREGLNSALPLGHNHLPELIRSMTTSQLAAMMPFATLEIDDGPGSNYYGQNQNSGNIILLNRKDNRAQDSPMGLIAGKTGSGKSFTAKGEIMNTILSNPKDKVIILDKAGEYTAITRALGGTVIEVKPGTKTIINPFYVADKEGRITIEELSKKNEVMTAALAADRELSAGELSIITTAVNRTYRRAQEQHTTPILSDFYEALRQENDSETARMYATDLALQCRRYIEKPNNFLDGHTNIDLSPRIIDVNFSELDESVLSFGYVAMMEILRSVIKANHEYKSIDPRSGREVADPITTWLYIEEIKSVMNLPRVLKVFSRFASEGRKQDLVLTGITQVFSDIFESSLARDMAKNADFVILLSQSGDDLKLAREIWELSDVECSSIRMGIKPGTGLILSGARHVAFDGRLPKKSILYDLYNTDPGAVQALMAGR